MLENAVKYTHPHRTRFGAVILAVGLRKAPLPARANLVAHQHRLLLGAIETTTPKRGSVDLLLGNAQPDKEVGGVK